MAISNPENYLTQAAADARYQAVGSLGSSTPTQVDEGDTGSAGVSTSAARSDHEHPVGIAASELVPAAWLAAWTSWTPTFTNFTLGNGTVVARYVQMGKTVHFRVLVTLGSTSAMGTNPLLTLPVTAVTGYGTADQVAYGKIADSGTADYIAAAWINTTSQLRLVVHNGASGVAAQVTAAVPMAWTTGDSFSLVGTYEAA